MYTRRRIQWLVGLGALVFGLLLVCEAQDAAAARPADQPEPDLEMLRIEDDLAHDTITQQFPHTLPMRLRIAREIRMLQQEDTATSLKLLSEVGMYFCPGVMGDGFCGMRIPFPPEEGSRDVELVLSNRRVLKVLAECAKLPRKEAGIMVRDELHDALAVYQLMFEAEWKHVVRVRLEHPVEGQAFYASGPSLQTSNNPDGTPTLCGQRFKVLALLLVAGDLRLAEAKDEVVAATKLALEQRERFYHGHDAAEGDRHSMLRSVGIYNRQILAIANGGMVSRELAPALDRERKELTTFEASATTYDAASPGGMFLPADFSQGSIEVWIYKPLTDQQFDEFLKAIR